MGTWELINCIETVEDDAGNPTLPITSEACLREELERLRHRVHGHVMLASPAEDALSISIGGPYASFGWIPPADQRRTQGQREALADRRYSPESVECWGEGVPTKIQPEFLFPVEQAIEAIVHFYITHELPKWISWREWDPERQQWRITPAASAVERLFAS